MRKTKFDPVWMRLALDLSRFSTCRRANVGCVVVTEDAQQVLAIGYNGSYKGGPNDCDRDTPGDCGCLHAEDNASIKLDYNNPIRKIIYTTNAPCAYCAKRIVNAGISEVIYLREYRKTEGLEILAKAQIPVTKMEDGFLSVDPYGPPGEVRQQLRADPIQGVGHFPAGGGVDQKAQDQDPVPAGKAPEDVPA